MHICVSNLSLSQIKACHLFGVKPLSESMLEYCLLDLRGTNFNEISIHTRTFSFKKFHYKMSSAKWHPLCLGLSVLNQPMASYARNASTSRHHVFCFRNIMHVFYHCSKLYCLIPWFRLYRGPTIYIGAQSIDNNLRQFMKPCVMVLLHILPSYNTALGSLTWGSVTV